jgi:acetyl-CoA carboxylase biotin carboxyl carrier protein
VELDFNELRELLTLLNQTDIAELILKSNEFELTLRKKGMGGSDRSPVLTPPITTPITGVDAIATPTPLSLPPTPVASVPTPTPAPAPAPAPASAPAPRASDKLVDVISPMVGTFYRSPAPDEAPFVNVGDRIRTGQTVCIIEAMKLMNELESEVSGEIVEILVQNGDPVEYGQPLMRVNPS